MELLGSNIKKFQEMETPKKNPYISGIGNPKKASYFWEMELFSPPQKISYIFSKESFCYIFGKGNPQKTFV